MAVPKPPSLNQTRVRPLRKYGGGTYFSGIGNAPPGYIPPIAKAAAMHVTKVAPPPAPRRTAPPPPPKPNPNVTGPLGSNPLGTLPSTGGHVSNPYWQPSPKKQMTR